MQAKNNFTCKEMLSALQNANSILLCTHISPDGDAIGSTLAMGLALEAMGKQVTLACHHPVPEYLDFLPGKQLFVLPETLVGKFFDAALAIDCADLGRMGDCRVYYQGTALQLQIDHHPTNPLYAHMNLVDGDASASGCIVMRVLNALNIPLTAEMAMCLYAAISTDTGNFCFKNTNAEAFACAAMLIDAGLDINDCARRLHLLRQQAHVRLLGRALCSLHIFGNGKCAGMRLTHQDYQAAGAGPEHTDKIVNYALDLPGVEMAYLVDERDVGFAKVSLRAQPPRNVAVIAQQFGGGGHILAAGCRGQMPIDEMAALIENEMLAQIEEKS